MSADPRTVTELQQAGFTHLRLTCPASPRIVMYPFKLIRARNPSMVIDGMTAADLGARFRCDQPHRRRRPVRSVRLARRATKSRTTFARRRRMATTSRRLGGKGGPLSLMDRRISGPQVNGGTFDANKIEGRSLHLIGSNDEARRKVGAATGFYPKGQSIHLVIATRAWRSPSQEGQRFQPIPYERRRQDDTGHLDFFTDASAPS
jgi:hypothetical protein